MENNEAKKFLEEKLREILENFSSNIFEKGIVYDNLYLGKITLNYEEYKEIKGFYPNLYNFWIRSELFKSVNIFFQKDMEFVINLKKKIKSELELFPLLFIYFPNLELFKLSSNITFPDDIIFEIIEKEGPIAFRNTDIQDRLNEWFLDKENCAIKINKLRDSLLEYSLKKSSKLPFKQGRPETDIFRKFGTKWLIEFYKDILSTLKIVKENYELKNSYNITENINQAFKKIMIKKKEKYKKSGLNSSDNKIDSINDYLEWHSRYVEKEGIPSALARIIESKENMKSQFERMNWEPNQFAKEILASLFDVSKSKIEKILYDRK